MDNLRIYDDQWKLITFLDLPELTNGTDTMLKYLNGIALKCETISQHCIAHPQIQLLQSRISTILQTQNEIAQLVGHSTLHTRESEMQALLNRKRRAPFDFIGKVSKILFGTLDSEDAEYYNDQIDKAYNTTEHLAEILSDQTHIVKSTLGKIQNTVNNLTTTLFDTQRSFYQIKNIADKLKQEIATEELNTQIIALLVEFDRYLNKYEMDLADIVNAILFAKHGSIHPKILSPSHLIDSLRKIHMYKPNVNMPVPLEVEYAEELIRISKLEVAYFKHRLIYILAIPLPTSMTFSTYHLIPIPTAQSAFTDKFAYIVPTAPYVALSADRLFFTFFSEIKFSQCTKTLGQILCKRTQPLFHSQTKDVCEVTLFINPQKFNLRSCDIRLVSMAVSFWTQLRTPNTWIYSIPSTEQLHISCPNEETIPLTLNKTGILTIKPRCTGNSDTTILTTSHTFRSIHNTSLNPPINLNISNLQPSLQLTNMSELQLTTIHKGTHIDELDLAETGTKLTDIMKQLENIKIQKRTSRDFETIQSKMYSAGYVIVIIIIGVILIRFIPFMKLRSLCKKENQPVHNAIIYTPVQTNQPITITQPSTSNDGKQNVSPTGKQKQTFYTTNY